jgi:peptide/nickel transport system permease protein/oligopeptide transport system permease protein
VARFLIRRLALAVVVLVALTIAVFAMQAVTPGDPATLLLGENASPQQIAALRTELGLDQPLPAQYARFLIRLVTQRSLGNSIRTGRPVLVELSERLPYTLELALLAVALSSLVGIPMGVLAAVNRGRPADLASMAGAILGVSIPSFWLALLMMMLLGSRLRLLPLAGAGDWRNLIMPTLTLAFPALAVKARLTRSAVLEVLHNDYVRTARAKGLAERLVLGRHVLRTALLPVVTVIGLQFGGLLGGAFITETIFAWPGVGRLAVQAVSTRDFPIIQGTVLLVAMAYVVSNLVVDVAYAALDPRVRLR